MSFREPSIGRSVFVAPVSPPAAARLQAATVFRAVLPENSSAPRSLSSPLSFFLVDGDRDGVQIETEAQQLRLEELQDRERIDDGRRIERGAQDRGEGDGRLRL